MSERTLQSVVADLRPLVGPKLEAEQNSHLGPGGSANAKRGTLEIHRGDSYQFGYFLQKAVPHAVVLKSRDYFMDNRPPQNEGFPSRESQNENGPVLPSKIAKRTKRARKKTAQQKKAVNRKWKGKGRAEDIIEIESSEEEAEESILTDMEDEAADEAQPVIRRRSTRRKRPRTVYREISEEENDSGNNDNGLINKGGMAVDDEDDIQVKEEATNDDVALRDVTVGGPEHDGFDTSIPPDFGIDEDEDDKKLKPKLQVSFRRLLMQDRCLCVIVQPWPLPAQATPNPDKRPGRCEPSMEPSVPDANVARTPTTARYSVDPGMEAAREQTPVPLFLTDPFGQDRSTTPAPVRFPIEFSNLVIIEDTGDQMEEEDEFSMLAFSQALSRVSGSGIGATEEDDDMDGGALYGDADEIRGAFQ